METWDLSGILGIFVTCKWFVFILFYSFFLFLFFVLTFVVM